MLKYFCKKCGEEKVGGICLGCRKKYYSEYRKKYRHELNKAKREKRSMWAKRAKEKRGVTLNPTPEVKGVNEYNLEVIEIYCSDFNCGKQLTRQEKLFGNKCINHSIKEFNE